MLSATDAGAWTCGVLSIQWSDPGSVAGAWISSLLGRRMRLFKMIDLGEMLRGMAELETYPLVMPTVRKPSAFDHGHVVRHVGMYRILGDRVDP